MKAIATLTAGQAQMLKNIMCNEHQPLNGRVPDQFSDIREIWTSEVVRSFADKGTLTSLINAGLVVHWGRGADSCVRMTQEGWDAIVNNQASRGAWIKGDDEEYEYIPSAEELS